MTHRMTRVPKCQNRPMQLLHVVPPMPAWQQGKDIGEGEHRPLLDAWGVCMWMSVYSGDMLLLTGSLLPMVSKQVNIDLATGREREDRTDMHGWFFTIRIYDAEHGCGSVCICEAGGDAYLALGKCQAWLAWRYRKRDRGRRTCLWRGVWCEQGEAKTT